MKRGPLKSCWFFFILLSCPFVFACKNKVPKPAVVSSAAVAGDSIIGKKILVPDSMEAYVAFKDHLLLDSAQLAKRASYKIYSFINVSCSSCIPDIDHWNELIPAFMQKGVPVILVCYTKDNFEYIKYLFETGMVKRFPFPVYLDTRNHFFKQNPFIKNDILHQTVLTDENNTVVLTGDPLRLEKVKTAYMERIKK